MKYQLLSVILIMYSNYAQARDANYRCIDSSGKSVLEFHFSKVEKEVLKGSLTTEEFIQKVKFSKWVPAYLFVTKDYVGRALKSRRESFALFPEQAESTASGYTGSIVLDSLISVDGDYYMSKELHLHRVFSRSKIIRITSRSHISKNEYIQLETIDSMHATYKIYDDGELTQVRLLCSPSTK